jgi:hypothetical protein
MGYWFFQEFNIKHQIWNAMSGPGINGVLGNKGGRFYTGSHNFVWAQHSSIPAFQYSGFEVKRSTVR